MKHVFNKADYLLELLIFFFLYLSSFFLLLEYVRNVNVLLQVTRV